MEFLGTPTPYAPAADGTVVVYTGVTLLDGYGGPARPHMAIVVEGERIRAVVPDSEPPPDGAEVADMVGRYVIPGLID